MNNNINVQKVALIFGITGQTGSYLVEHLHNLSNYVVHGVIRRTSNFNTERIIGIFPSIRDNLHYGDILDPLFIINILNKIQPDEIYNLSAQSHVQVSFQLPLYSTQVNALGVLNLLEGIRLCELKDKTRLYQANTSEMYGGHYKDYDKSTWNAIQKYGMNEKTPFFPKSPYGAAKLFAHHLVNIYRDSYGIFVCSGICFNHESERRDPRFVTRKVTRTIARIFLGKEDVLVLGNLNAERDWGHAADYVKAIHLCLQQEKATDIVIASGKTHSVRYLVETAFAVIGVKIKWEGENENECGKCSSTGKTLVIISPKYYRPNEVHYLKGDANLANNLLGWKAETTFENMIHSMVKNDIRIES
jgi:GDPmannose 4,6-dehydratase